MINWYFPLYLGIVFILWLFAHIGTHRNINHYLKGSKDLVGLSLGTNLLLGHLVSGETILLSIVAVVNWGLWGGLGFTLLELVSLLLVAYLIVQIKQRQLLGEDILKSIQRQLHIPNYNWLLGAFTFCSLGNIVLQGLVLKYLLGSTLTYSFWGSLLFLSIFSLVWSGLGGFGALSQGIKLQVLFIFFTTALVTASVFLEKGISSTYEGWIRISQVPLVEDKFFFLLMIGIVFRLVQRLLDNCLWQVSAQIKPHRLLPVWGLTILCYLAIPLAFSAMTVLGLTQGIDYYQGNILIILRNFNFSFLLNFYVTGVFIVVTSTYATSLYGIISLYLANQQKEIPILKAYALALGTVSLCLIGVLLLKNYPLLNYLKTLTLAYLCLLISLLLGLLRKTVKDFIKID